MKLKKVISLFLSIVTVIGSINTAMASEATEYVNVALFKPSEASGYIDALHSPDKANDGVNANPQYSAWISKQGEKAWWSVDLLLEYRIDYIEIESRKGNDDTTAYNSIRVIGSNDKDFSKYSVLYDDKIATQEIPGVWKFKSNNRGKFRYVKIERTDVGAVEIGEIRLLTDRNAVYSVENGEAAVEKLPGEVFVMPKDVTTDFEKSVVAAMDGLEILKPLSNDTFGMYNEVSRADLAKAVCKFVGLSEDMCSFSSELPFSDIKEDTYNARYISTAYQSGLVSGASKKQFKPEEPVKVEEAIIAVTKALGCGAILNSSGIKDILDLANGVSTAYSDVLTRYDLALILYNALDEKVWVTNFNGTTTKSDVTALAEFHKAYKNRGILIGDERTQISSFISVPEGMLYIDKTLYYSGDLKLNSFVGMQIEYIYTNREDTLTLLSAVPTNRNNVTKLDAIDIKDFVNDELIYYRGDKAKYIDIPKEAYIVYNGKAQPDRGREFLNPQNGYVLLVDNNGDNKVDVVFVYDAIIGIVNWVDKENGQIYLKNNYVPIKTEDVSFSVFMDGKEIAISDILTNDLIYVYQNTIDVNNKVVICDIYRKTLTASITEYCDEYLTVDDVDYVYIKSNIDISKIKFSDVYTIYLGENDVIVALEKSEAGRLQYGYLQKVHLNKRDENITFKVFTESGTFVEFLSASKVVMDGYKYTTYQEMVTHLTNINSSKGRIDGLIKYAINSKNQITHFDTTQQCPNEDADALSDVVYTANNAYYKSSGILGGQYDVSNSVVFYIPSNIDMDRDYSVGSTSGFMNNSQHSFKGYDCNDKRQLGVLLSDGVVSVEESEAISIVVKTKLVYTENEEIATEVVVYRNGELTSFYALDSLGESFEAGDLCQFTVNAYNEIVNVVRIKSKTPSASDKFNTSTNVINSFTHGNLYAGYGKVVMKNGHNFAVEMDKGTGTEMYMGSLQEKGAYVYVYDSSLSNNAVRLGSIDDIRDATSVGMTDADTVIFRTKAADLKEVFILR